MMKKLGLIILAGGDISHKLSFILEAAQHPALIPVGLKSAFSHNIEFYKADISSIVLVTRPGSLKFILSEFNSISKASDIKLTIIEKDTNSILESLQLALSSADDSIQEWIVSPITTIPIEMPKTKSIVFEKISRRSNGWSILKKTKDVNSFISRNSTNHEPGYAFTGLIRANITDLRISSATCKSKDLIELAEKLYKKKYLIEFSEWIDIGHSTNYYVAKSKLISSRHFNRIEIDICRGILTKKSINFKKIKNEESYIEGLPDDLKIWFPRQIKQKNRNKDSSSSIIMEYYAYPTVAELALYWQLNFSQWELLFNSLKTVIKSFQDHACKISKSDYKRFYIEKLKQRIKEFYNQNSTYSNIFSKKIKVNGVLIEPLSAYLPNIEKTIDSFYRPEDCSVMHGDLCFNNILFDPYGGTIRLIDPRGSFIGDKVDSRGDIKYDLAKLAHSSIYGYDYLIAGHFELNSNFSNSEFNYKILYNENQSIIKELYLELLIELGFNYNEMKFLTALLYLSMASLHNDNKYRQLTMYLHGLFLLNEYYF